ncbi:MAG: cation transporter [Erysipelothrix sp.]|nr:cation transporter [Erysipelothrix sp.]
MTHYRLSTIHCANCAKTMEAQLQALDDKIRLNYEHDTLVVPENVPLSDVKKILAIEKIVILEDDFETHDTDHAHHHHHDTSSKNMAVVFFMNVIFSVSEFIFGFLFNSSAILTDAVHDFGDALSIGLAWFFEKISSREPSRKYSFGHRRFSLLGALITSTILIVGSILALLSSLPRLFNPQPVNYEGMFLLAIAAIGMNLFGTWLLSKGSSKNEKVLSRHLLEDMLGGIAILVMSFVLRFQPWYFLDPLLSIGLAIFILTHAVPPFVESISIFLEAVPEHVDLQSVESDIRQIKGIHALSHFHFWSIDGSENAAAITVYTDSPDVAFHESLREEIRVLLAKQHVTHSTIEVVYDPALLVM